jgi:hypothetical protein
MQDDTYSTVLFPWSPVHDSLNRRRFDRFRVPTFPSRAKDCQQGVPLLFGVAWEVGNAARAACCPCQPLAPCTTVLRADVPWIIPIVREVVLARQDAQGAPCKFSSLADPPARATPQFARRGLGQGTGHGSTLNLRGTQRIQPMGSGQLPQDGQE